MITKTERKILREEWEKRIEAYKSSGQSATKWCAEHNLRPNQLWYWLRKFKEEATESSTTKWVSLPVSDTIDDPAERLYIRVGQAVIEIKSGFDPVLLSQVVRTLKTLC